MKANHGLVFIALSALIFAGCFSPYRDTGSVITINLAGGRAAAYPPDAATLASLTHTITLTGPSGTETHTLAPGELSLTVEVFAGS